MPRNSLVWDCACGNGQATLDLAQCFDRVVATDASPEQIAWATPDPKVEFRAAPAERGELTDESVGLITVAQALHWFDDLRNAAAIGLGILFTFTAIGHFTQTEAMAQMLPPWVPARVPLIYATGFLELAIAAGFILRKFRRFTGWIAGAFLMAVFPSNIYAAMNHVPMVGHAWGLVYLLVRAPLQLIILLWIYWFTLRQPGLQSGHTSAAPRQR